MDDALTYRFRPSLPKAEVAFRLTGEGLAWPDGSLAFADIREIRVYGAPGLTLAAAGQVAAPGLRCVVRPRRGRAVVLASQHFLGLGRFEDRSAALTPFVAALLQRTAAANPQARLVAGMPPALWWTWLAVLVLALLGGAVALVMIVIGAGAGRIVSLDTLFAAVFLVGMASLAVSIVRVLRGGGSRRLDRA